MSLLSPDGGAGAPGPRSPPQTLRAGGSFAGALMQGLEPAPWSLQQQEQQEQQVQEQQQQQPAPRSADCLYHSRKSNSRVQNIGNQLRLVLGRKTVLPLRQAFCSCAAELEQPVPSIEEVLQVFQSLELPLSVQQSADWRAALWRLHALLAAPAKDVLVKARPERRQAVQTLVVHMPSVEAGLFLGRRGMNVRGICQECKVRLTGTKSGLYTTFVCQPMPKARAADVETAVAKLRSWWLNVQRRQQAHRERRKNMVIPHAPLDPPTSVPAWNVKQHNLIEYERQFGHHDRSRKTRKYHPAEPLLQCNLCHAVHTKSSGEAGAACKHHPGFVDATGQWSCCHQPPRADKDSLHEDHLVYGCQERADGHVWVPTAHSRATARTGTRRHPGKPARSPKNSAKKRRIQTKRLAVDH